MEFREIKGNEVSELLDCVMQLSEYHNTISVNFKGRYPSRPYGETLNVFSESLEKGQSRIAVIESGEKVVGFCKVDINGKNGKLDYLVVLQEYRQQGFGKQFMEWAMETFRKNNVTRIEVKVVDGNDAIHFYEKYGFQINSHILWRCEE